ncbi:hypothetical protein OXX79_006850 [Metschnikowia pulcherrima]
MRQSPSQKSTVPKSQPSISRFFAPRESPKPDVKKSATGEIDTQTKKRLDVFSHSPSKKQKAENGNLNNVETSSAQETTSTTPTSAHNESLKDDMETSQHIVIDDVIDDENEDAGDTLESSKASLLASFRQNGDSEASSSPELEQTPKSAKSAKSTKSAKSAKLTNSAKSAKPARAAKPKAAAKMTPLEQQYKDLKARHMDKVLAIQVGYKFKFFGQDAVVASQLLNIMLIPGNLDLDERKHDRYAYCSIPDNRLHIHLQRLLNHGLKVGVVKQTETAAVKSVESTNKSSLFSREVTAVYTKATYMGDEAVNGVPEKYGDSGAAAESDRYIICIDESDPAKTGIVAVQPATGDIVHDYFADTLAREKLETRLAYLNPSEAIVICRNKHVSKESSLALKLQNPAISISVIEKRPTQDVQMSLTEFFSGLDSNGRYAHMPEYVILNFSEPVQCCILELINYLKEFNLSNVFTLTSNYSSFTESGRYMVLPATTLRALDIFQVDQDPAARQGTLFWLLNHTQTRKGASMLRSWIGKPLVSKDEIEKRLDAVQSLVSGEFVHILDAFKSLLTKIGKGGVDLDKLLIKIHYSATYNTEKITRKELFSMLKCFLDIIMVLRNFGDAGISDLRRTFAKSELLTEIMESLLKASKEQIVDRILGQINGGVAISDKDVTEQKTNFFIHENNTKYAAITEEFAHIEEIEEALEQELQAVRKLLKRPQLQFVTNLKDTHLIEVRNGKMVDALPRDWLRISGTKTVSRFRPPNVSKLHKKLQYHNDRLLKECDACFHQFLQEIDAEYEYLREIVFNLSRFDCLLSLSTLAQKDGNIDYVKPRLADEQLVDIRSGCHPILSKLPQNVGAYVPNDVKMSYDENKVLIITGPNMGGKSSLVKQIALFVIMAQVGSFLPCSEATMGVFDSIYIRMGASDNILKGKSTFMVEMSECASIINNYTPRSLIILDEIGRGTGTSDGIALAYAILKYIIEDENGPLTLFITHYPSLHVLEHEHNIVSNHHMAFVEKHSQDGDEKDWPEVIFLYKLVAGVVSNSYGLNVAKLAGIEKEVIDAAHTMSETMKADVERSEILGALSQLTSKNAFDVLSKLS